MVTGSGREPVAARQAAYDEDERADQGASGDLVFADRLVSAQNLPIVDALRDRMLGLHRSRLSNETAQDDQSKQGAA